MVVCSDLYLSLRESTAGARKLDPFFLVIDTLPPCSYYGFGNLQYHSSSSSGMRARQWLNVAADELASEGAYCDFF